MTIEKHDKVEIIGPTTAGDITTLGQTGTTSYTGTLRGNVVYYVDLDAPCATYILGDFYPLSSLSLVKKHEVKKDIHGKYTKTKDGKSAYDPYGKEPISDICCPRCGSNIKPMGIGPKWICCNEGCTWVGVPSEGD